MEHSATMAHTAILFNRMICFPFPRYAAEAIPETAAENNDQIVDVKHYNRCR